MTLSAELSAVLPAETAQAWELIAPVVPDRYRLAGGTALAVHLHHRQSRDLDFFSVKPDPDLPALERRLNELGSFAVSSRTPNTLNGVFEAAKVQFLDAHDQVELAPPERHEGILVSSVSDVLAMKIKVIGDRGELRDYFDLKRIEELAGRRVEEGIGLYMARYQIPPEHPSIEHVLEALGYLDDVDEDDMIPESRKEIAKYWARRQREITRNLSRFPNA
jgi:predicted nucleotidyltransferase component of viral defense system